MEDLQCFSLAEVGVIGVVDVGVRIDRDGDGHCEHLRHDGVAADDEQAVVGEDLADLHVDGGGGVVGPALQRHAQLDVLVVPVLVEGRVAELLERSVDGVRGGSVGGDVELFQEDGRRPRLVGDSVGGARCDRREHEPHVLGAAGDVLARAAALDDPLLAEPALEVSLGARGVAVAHDQDGVTSEEEGDDGGERRVVHDELRGIP